MAKKPKESTSFQGFPKKGITWLRQIVKNNRRDWFLENKPTYENEVRAPTLALVEALNAKLKGFAPDHVAEPKKAVPRIYRDVRFSKDKSPYKTYTAAKFGKVGSDGKAGGPGDCAGFWLSVSAKGVDVVGGAHSPGSPQLAALRAHIAENKKELERLIKRKALSDAMGELQGEKLVRVPRGWPAEHPAAELLKHKQLYFHAHLPVSIATTPDLLKEITRRFRLLTPFVEYLNAGLMAGARG